jgi:hypothetical protein
MAGEVGRRWGVGIEVDGAFMHTIEGSGVDSGPTNARLLSASAVALWLDKEAGLNAAASLGLCTAEIHGRSEFIGGLPEYTVTDNLDEAMFGPRFALRGGVEWPNRLGIAITWSLSYLVGSDSKYVPMTAAVQGTASWW